MSSNFQYQPLPQSGPKRIRLLRIHPTQLGTQLQVDFVQTPLGPGMPEFSAISYAWDGQVPTRPIRIGQRTALITAKLERALVVMNQRYPGYLFWADGICINQKDAAEKASQVMVMNLIYGYAQSTLVWLGDPDRTRQPNTWQLFSMLLDNRGHEITAAHWRARFLPGLWREVSWFSRVWVVQEVGCNNTDIVKLLFGPTWELDWEHLLQSLPPISPYNWQDGRWTDAEKIEGLLHIRDEHAKRGSILFMMERFASFGCTHERDRIPAMAGMQNPQPDSHHDITGLAVDYSSEDRDMFLRFATHMVDRGFGLALLWLAAIKGPRQRPWPSWVPGWSNNPGRKPALDIDDFHGYDNEYPPRYSRPTGSTLTIRCSKLDTYCNGYLATFNKPRPKGHTISLVLEADEPGYYRLTGSLRLQGQVRGTSVGTVLHIR